jgi:hypothetical protein
MRLPRFGIASMMALVVIAALDCAAYRACYYTFWTNHAAWANQLDVLFIGAVPMSNVLIVGLLLALRRRGNRPFLLGFEVFGLVAWVAYIALVAFHCHTLVRPYLFRFQDPVFDAIGRSQAHIPIFVFTAAVILGWWQLTLALIGGFISWSIWGSTSGHERHLPVTR